MIELRYLLRWTPQADYSTKERVLQSRQKPDTQHGYPETTWGPWEDVPEVEDAS